MQQDEKNNNMSQSGFNTEETELRQDGKTPAEEEKTQIDLPFANEVQEGAPIEDGSDSYNEAEDGKATVAVSDEEAEVAEEEEDEEVKRPKKRKHRVLRAVIYSVSIVIVSAVLAAAVLYSVTDYLGLFRPEVEKNVKIPSGASISEIADILQDDGIIRSSLVFNAYMSITKKHGLKDGTYALNSHMSYKEIVRTLKNSENRATVKVTIPEGYTVERIAELLEKNSVCSRSDFLKSADSASIDFDFQSEIPDYEKRFYRLEGYLFPDTYEFYVDSSSDTVVKKMLANFDKRFDDELREKAKKMGMSVDEVVTLASIIQTESSNTSEMRAVSSVFHNRLEKGVNGVKMLQSDATVLYAKNSEETSSLSTKEQVAAGYNTYEVEGLPAGPISNPGLAAIKAALSPADTSYYFFVSDKEGNYYYAKTYNQHLKNIKKAQKVGQAGGTDVADK